MDKEYLSYKIEAIIKGEKYTLRKVGPPSDEPDVLRKIMLRGYISQQFRDVMDKFEDITEITYKKGRKVLHKYHYNE